MTPQSSPGIVPIILAAGDSRRMGRPKTLLDLDGGITCLEKALRTCRQAGLGPPVVVLGLAAEQIRARVLLDGVRVVINARPERGQTASLQVGLLELPEQSEAFLLYPVDFPLVDEPAVRAIVAAWHARARAELIVIPSYAHRRGHPVLIDASLAREVLALADGLPARQVIDAHAAAIRYVEMSDDAVLVDMDTPEDYQRCLRRLTSAASKR